MDAKSLLDAVREVLTGLRSETRVRASFAPAARQRRFRDLEQILFDTEQVAHRVASAAGDPLTAGLIANFALRDVANIGPEHFPDIERKRTWASAKGALTGAARRVAGDAALAQAVSRYMETLDRWEALRAACAPGCEGDAEGAENERSLARGTYEANLRSVKHGLVGSGVGLALAVLGWLLLVNGAASAHLMALGLAVLVPSALLSGNSEQLKVSAPRARNAEAAAEQARAIHGEYQAFLADPERMGFLEDTWSQHPLLIDDAPPVAPPAVQVERHVIERQMVVIRCKYCDNLVPVDAKECRVCGKPQVA